MSLSQHTAKEFYDQIKTEGLMALSSEFSPLVPTLNLVKTILDKTDHILDLCCGYGRITLPLASLGYKIEGFDLSAEMIAFAEHEARSMNLAIKFRTGDMCSLPYNDDTFDKVLCLWNSFNHLLYESDQVESLKEIYRVLKKGGVALVELFYKEEHVLKADTDYNPPYYNTKLCNTPFTIFVQTAKNLSHLCQKAGIQTSSHELKEIGDRKRLLLWISKV